MTPLESKIYTATYGAAFAANQSAPAADKIAERSVLGFRALVAGKNGRLLMPVAEGNVTPPEPETEDDS